MSDTANTVRMSASEYLDWEPRQDGKHEFHHGEVFAMAGGSPRHNYLSNAVGAELRATLRSHGCSVLSSDQRIAADPGKRFVYPDAVAVCGELRMEPSGADVLANPTVVVEVLSPSTEVYDRGGKWEAYQRLESLTDFLLMSQDAVRVEHYRRESDGSWRYRVVGEAGRVDLAAGGSLNVDAVYEGAFALPAG